MPNSHDTTEQITDWPLTTIIQLQDVPPSGKHLPFKATPEECAAVAEFLEVPKVASIQAELHIKPYSNGDVRVTGTIEALVTYMCGITLQPFEDEIHAEANVLYVDSVRRKELLSKWDLDDILDLDKDIPDELINGLIPIGGLICEHLALGVEPYPRAPGAAFEGDDEAEQDIKPASPFGVLKGLQK